MVFKNIFNQILPSFLLVHKTQHTVSRSVSRCVGKFCYQRSQNLCRRFRQLCPLQVCECQDCLISPHYHTCQVSACPCWSEVLLLSPSSLFLGRQGGWFCYQFRDFYLFVVLLLFFRSALCTCSPSAGHDTQSIQPPVSRPSRPPTWLKNRNPGNNRPRSPHSRWLKPATLGFVNATHFFLGRSLRGDLLPTWTPAQSGAPPSTAVTIQRVFPKSTPTSSGRPTRVESIRFNPFPFDDLPESASQQSVQLCSRPPAGTFQLRVQNSLFR